MSIAVTGANGFIGRHLVAAAARRRLPVRAIVRHEATPAAGADAVVVPDLLDVVSLRRAIAGAEVVFHLAARVHVMRDSARDPLAAFRLVNVDGTRAVMEAAAQTGVRLVVFVSTVKVNGEGRTEPYRDIDPPAPCDPYGISKHEAERIVLENGAVEGIVVRPPLVYGPGVRGNFLRLIRMAHWARHVPIPLGGIGNRRSLVFVENLVDALLHLSTCATAARRCFLVADDERLSTSELIARIASAGGWRARMVPCPTTLASAAARWMGRAADIDRLLGTLVVDDSALRATGWQPIATVGEGLSKTVAWWQTTAGGRG